MGEGFFFAAQLLRSGSIRARPLADTNEQLIGTLSWRSARNPHPPKKTGPWVLGLEGEPWAPNCAYGRFEPKPTPNSIEPGIPNLGDEGSLTGIRFPGFRG
jgi:hypothetical protein